MEGQTAKHEILLRCDNERKLGSSIDKKQIPIEVKKNGILMPWEDIMRAKYQSYDKRKPSTGSTLE